jgi:general secretion pathway protein J
LDFLQKMNRRAGFSLLEALVALVLTTLLLVTLTPLVRQMLTTWLRGGDVAGLVELEVRGIGTLRRDLASAIVWTGSGNVDDLLIFRGTETSMSFPAIANYAHGVSQLEMISISVGNTANGHVLIRRHASVAGTTYSSFSDPVVLFSGPYRYFFSYYSREGQEMPVWTNPEGPPARVAVNIVDGSDQKVSVDISVTASMSAVCVLNANLRGCAAVPQQKDAQAKELEKIFQ